MSTVTQENMEDYIDGVIRGDAVLADPIEGREPLVRGSHDFAFITEVVCKVPESPLKETNKLLLAACRARREHAQSARRVPPALVAEGGRVGRQRQYRTRQLEQSTA